MDTIELPDCLAPRDVAGPVTDCYVVDGQTVTIYWQGETYLHTVQDGAVFETALAGECVRDNGYPPDAPCTGITQSLPIGQTAIAETGMNELVFIIGIPLALAALAVGISIVVRNYRKGRA